MDVSFLNFQKHGTNALWNGGVLAVAWTTFLRWVISSFVNPLKCCQQAASSSESSLQRLLIRCRTLMMAFYANLPYAQAPGMWASECLLYLYRCIWYGYHGEALYALSRSDFIDITLTKCSEDDQYRIAPDSSSLCYFSGDRDFLGLCWELRMQGFLKFNDWPSYLYSGRWSGARKTNQDSRA